MTNLESIARKVPGFRELLHKIDFQDEQIIKLEYENLLLAQQLIDLRIHSKIKNGEKINVVFVCHRPAVWESLHSVYDALKEDSQFSVNIVAIPNKKELPQLGLQHEIYESEGAEEFWKSYGCLNGYDYQTGVWLDLKNLEPDYVFFQQPYNISKPMLYSSAVVSKYAKIAYVAYFAPTDLDVIYDECAPVDFLKDASFYFAQHVDDYKHILERYKGIGVHNCKIYNTGFPRYDRIEQNMGSDCDIWEQKSAFKILWTPRWTTNEDNCFFFEYKNNFTQYCRDHRDVEFVFRPHPQAFKEWRATGEMTEREEIQYRKEFEEINNMHLDEGANYYSIMFSSDCLVTDKSSMMIDYCFTGKPIIYCRKNNHNSDVIKRIGDGLYMVYSWDELIKELDRIKNGEDRLKEIRRQIVNEYLKPHQEMAAEIICKILKQDDLSYDYLEGRVF